MDLSQSMYVKLDKKMSKIDENSRKEIDTVKEEIINSGGDD